MHLLLALSLAWGTVSAHSAGMASPDSNDSLAVEATLIEQSEVSPCHGDAAPTQGDSLSDAPAIGTMPCCDDDGACLTGCSASTCHGITALTLPMLHDAGNWPRHAILFEAGESPMPMHGVLRELLRPPARLL